jgi:hypothetical protein
VGLALLAGHANANTTEEIGVDKPAGLLKDADNVVQMGAAAHKQRAQGAHEAGGTGESGNAEDALNLHSKKLQIRNEQVSVICYMFYVISYMLYVIWYFQFYFYDFYDFYSFYLYHY